MKQHFSTTDLGELRGNLIILDIDGTLAIDGARELDQEILARIHTLKEHNRVVICSNKPDAERNYAIANQAGVGIIQTPFRKPSKRLIRHIENDKNLPIVVIGDKWITDGLLAARLNAKFIKVRPVREKDRTIHLLFSFADKTLYDVFLKLDKVLPFLLVIRPWQWIKNVLIFAPAFFAGLILDGSVFVTLVWIFVVFCTSAGMVYIFNDINDSEGDRLHPEKRFRPIASRELSPQQAMVWLIFLGILTCLIVAVYAPQIAIIVFSYIVLNVAYSQYLKHVPIIDIVLVSIFYLLRVLAGGIGIGVRLSYWLILCTLFVSLFIIIGKRRAELIHAHKRKVLAYYSKKGLDLLLLITIALTVIAYAMYTVVGHASPYIIYSNILIIIAICRYIFIANKAGSVEFPEKVFFKDPIIFASFLVWLVYMFAVFYIL